MVFYIKLPIVHSTVCLLLLFLMLKKLIPNGHFDWKLNQLMFSVLYAWVCMS